MQHIGFRYESKCQFWSSVSGHGFSIGYSARLQSRQDSSVQYEAPVTGASPARLYAGRMSRDLAPVPGRGTPPASRGALHPLSARSTGRWIIALFLLQCYSAMVEITAPLYSTPVFWMIPSLVFLVPLHQRLVQAMLPHTPSSNYTFSTRIADACSPAVDDLAHKGFSLAVAGTLLLSFLLFGA